MGRRLSRVAAALTVVVALCAGCGSSPVPKAVTGPAEDPVAVRAAFIKGLNGFCQAFYEDQKRVDERYPTLAVRGQYDRAQAAATKQDDQMLTALHPLPAMSQSFRRFVSNEKALYRARVAAITDDADGQTTVADDAFTQAFDRRHTLARAYGARECDGVLPGSERRAAVAALRRYERQPRSSSSLLHPGHAGVREEHLARPRRRCHLPPELRRAVQRALPAAHRDPGVLGQRCRAPLGDRALHRGTGLRLWRPRGPSLLRARSMADRSGGRLSGH